MGLERLSRSVDRSTAFDDVVRPSIGWLRTVRESLGITLTDLANRLKITPPAVRSFERAEAEDRITLGSLRRTANAIGCELIYALVPRTGTWSTLAETESRASGPSQIETSMPRSETHDGDNSAPKVTDKTWRALHGEL